jgi:hypothetical protein
MPLRAGIRGAGDCRPAAVQGVVPARLPIRISQLNGRVVTELRLIAGNHRLDRLQDRHRFRRVGLVGRGLGRVRRADPRGRLVLVPGELPAGDRLPLSSLSWIDPNYSGRGADGIAARSRCPMPSRAPW